MGNTKNLNDNELEQDNGDRERVPAPVVLVDNAVLRVSLRYDNYLLVYCKTGISAYGISGNGQGLIMFGSSLSAGYEMSSPSAINVSGTYNVQYENCDGIKGNQNFHVTV